MDLENHRPSSTGADVVTRSPGLTANEVADDTLPSIVTNQHLQSSQCVPHMLPNLTENTMQGQSLEVDSVDKGPNGALPSVPKRLTISIKKVNTVVQIPLKRPSSWL